MSAPPVPRACGSKPAARRLVADMFALLPGAARRGFDADLNRALSALLAARGRGMILGFAPLPDEPDIFPALRTWMRNGGALALPAWGGGSALSFRRVDDLDRDLLPGRGGVREPGAGLPAARPEEALAALVPGRAFAEDRLRLGRGAGCYDALLSRVHLQKIGIAYDFQVFPALPGDARDVAMDVVLTPSRAI